MSSRCALCQRRYCRRKAGNRAAGHQHPINNYFFSQLAWVLHVDVNCLNYDGNVVDAALLAVTAALQSSGFFGLLACLEQATDILNRITATLPRVLLPEEEGAEMTAVPPVDLQDRQPLKIQRRLCSATFVVMAPYV